MTASVRLLGLLCWILLGHSLSAQPITPSAPRPLVPAVDDPALTGLVAETLRAHPEVAAAKASVEASDALEQAAARPAFNPDLELSADSSRSDQRTLGFSQTFGVPGERRTRTAVAGLERQAAQAELASARSGLATELVGALADYRVADARDALMQRRLAVMQRFADLASRRRRAGDLTQVDLAAAELAFAQARIERANAAGALAEAAQSLQVLVPSPTPSAWPQLSTDLPPLTLEAGDVDRVLAELPEVRARRAAAEAAAARVDLRAIERRPSPTFGLQAGQEEGDRLVGLTFSMPLNIRNRFAAEVTAARAEQRQAAQSLANVELRARGRLLAATERYRLTREAWNGWAASGEPNLTEQTRLLERLWEAGDLSLTDYLVQLNQTFDTASSALDLRRELWRAWFDWLASSAQLGAWLGVPVE